MTIIFQGQGDAKRKAEDLSRKDKYKTFHVVKSVEGGLTYRVMDDISGMNVKSKVLLKFKNVLIEK